MNPNHRTHPKKHSLLGNIRVFAVALLLLAVTVGCKPQYPLPVTDINIGNQQFSIEIAISFKDQEKGLMYRDHLDSDHGMIFISDTPQIQTFWNANVNFPLDLLFLNEAGNIVSIKHMKPYDRTSVPSDAPAKYTIELLGGTAATLGLKVGDHIPLPPDVLHPNTVVVSH